MTLAGYWKSKEFFFAFGDLMGSIPKQSLDDGIPPPYPYSLENSDVVLPSGRNVPWGMEIIGRSVLAGWIQKVVVINKYLCLTWADRTSDACDLIDILRRQYGETRPTRESLNEDIDIFEYVKDRRLQFSLSLLEEDGCIHSKVFGYIRQEWQNRVFLVGGSGAGDFFKQLDRQILNQWAKEDFEKEDLPQKISEMMMIGSVLYAEEHTSPSAYQLGYGSGYEFATVFSADDGTEYFRKVSGYSTVVIRPMAKDNALAGFDRHFQIIKNIHRDGITSIYLVDVYLPLVPMDESGGKIEFRVFNVPEPGMTVIAHDANDDLFLGDVGPSSIILLGTQAMPGKYQIHTKLYIDQIKFEKHGEGWLAKFDYAFLKPLREICEAAYTEWSQGG